MMYIDSSMDPPLNMDPPLSLLILLPTVDTLTAHITVAYLVVHWKIVEFHRARQHQGQPV